MEAGREIIKDREVEKNMDCRKIERVSERVRERYRAS